MGRDTRYSILDVHLSAPFRLLRAVQPHLKAAVADVAAGRVVRHKVANISSLSGIAGNPGQSNFAAAKAGLLGLTKTLARSGVAMQSTPWRSA